MKFSIQSIIATTLALTAAVQAASIPSSAALAKRDIKGLNDWSCKPSAQHPEPVLLLHATLLTEDSWKDFVPSLVKFGHCVFALTYGKVDGNPFGAVNKLEISAQEVATFAQKVLDTTGAKQLNVVGHSQGGILARYWAKYLGGAGKVKRHIGVSPITHGTTLSGIVTLGNEFGLLIPAEPLVNSFCPGCYDMIVGSDFMNKINAGGDTIPGAIHSNIVTKYDEVVTPYLTGFETGTSTNQVVQDLCSLTLSEHLFMVNSDVVLRWVLNQLDPSTAKTVNCLAKLVV